MIRFIPGRYGTFTQVVSRCTNLKTNRRLSGFVKVRVREQIEEAIEEPVAAADAFQWMDFSAGANVWCLTWSRICK